MKRPFCHLRVRSDYSFGWGVSKIKELVQVAKANKQPAIALTDTNVLHGALEFSSAAYGAGIQPIVGVRLQVSTPAGLGGFTLLAKDERGYDLIRIAVRDALDPNLGNRGELPAATFDAIVDAPQGAVILVGVGGAPDESLLTMLLRSGKDARDGEAKVRSLVTRLRDAFQDDFFLEICRTGTEDKDAGRRERTILELAAAIDVPIVATSDVYHAKDTQDEVFALAQAATAVSQKLDVHLTMIDGKIQISDPAQRHLRSDDEMAKLFEDLPEAYENTLEVARRCHFKVYARKPILPPFDPNATEDEATQLRRKATDGLEQRLKALDSLADTKEAYFERLNYEADVIANMGFPGYFLIVADFINWAKRHNIPVGPGRGSGAGSVVAWALGITDLDPLRWGLLFERFLNPDRVSMPDFDVDFCQDRREEVVDYVRQRYGVDRVATISTFMGTKARSAVLTSARVLRPDGDPYHPREARSMSALIDVKAKNLTEAYDTTEALRTKVNANDRSRNLFTAARKLEGVYRGTGVHAAGVVIGDRPIVDLVPVGADPKSGHLAAQFNMNDVEKAGLVKFDFLGLKNMTIIQKAVDDVERVYGVKIDVMAIPFDDEKTYALFAAGATSGVFQFASSGMRSALRDVRPTRFEDLIAVVALYRPGPMENIPIYAACNKGEREPEYPEPVDQTSKYLGETYGIMVYQEQVMQVAQIVAGYSLGEADLLRRAMGKKKPEEMAKEKGKFVEGAKRNGTSPADAEALFARIEKFASYGFNKSHAAAYALIAYWTAWFKVNYPAAFYAATMSYEGEKFRADAFKEMKRKGIELLPLDINISRNTFMPEKRADGSGYDVRFGYCAVKNLQDADQVVAERQRNGPFKSVADFIARSEKSVKKPAKMTLAIVGCFDRLPIEEKGTEKIRRRPGNRRTVTNIFDKLCNAKKSNQSWNDGLFGDVLPSVTVPIELLDAEDYPDNPKKEFELLGFYYTSHPLDHLDADMKACFVKRMRSVHQYMVEAQRSELDNVPVYGMITNIQERTSTRNNRLFMSFDLVERDHVQKVMVWESVWSREGQTDFKSRLQKLEGKVPVVAYVSANLYTRESDQTEQLSVKLLEIKPAATLVEERSATHNRHIVIDALRYAYETRTGGPEKLAVIDAIIDNRAPRLGELDRIAQADELMRSVSSKDIVMTIASAMEGDETDDEDNGILTVFIGTSVPGHRNILQVDLPRAYRFHNCWNSVKRLSYVISFDDRSTVVTSQEDLRPGESYQTTSGQIYDIDALYTDDAKRDDYVMDDARY